MTAPAEEIPLADLSLDALAKDPEALDIVARFTRQQGEDVKPLKVAAFQSYIDVD